MNCPTCKDTGKVTRYHSWIGGSGTLVDCNDCYGGAKFAKRPVKKNLCKRFSAGCHQNWVNFYWTFETVGAARAYARKLKRRFPDTPLNCKIEEHVIWINSVVDSGRRECALTVSVHVGYLGVMLKLREDLTGAQNRI